MVSFTVAAAASSSSSSSNVKDEKSDSIESLLKDNEFKSKWTKWNLDGTSLQRFRSTERLQIGQEKDFFLQFFKDPQVAEVMPWQSSTFEKATEVSFQRLSTNILSMDFFDRLEEAGIVTQSGQLRRCMDEMFEEKLVSDMLGEMLLNPSSENAELYSSLEQKEYLFHLLKTLAVGGPICQVSESLEEYLSAVKALYRALMTVQRSTKTKEIEISTLVYKVNNVTQQDGGGRDDADPILFQHDCPFNTCYLIVDAKMRNITCWYAPYKSYW